MSVPSSPQVPIGAPSPTLTNPDMILPHGSFSEESAPSTSWKPQRKPSPPTVDNGHNRSGSAPEDRPRAKATMYSPFRNGVLRRHDGSTRLRSSSEKGDRRELSRFSYLADEGAPAASSPTLQEYCSGMDQESYAETARDDYDHAETRDSVYSTPAILEEDENDPLSHAAMTKRAEEILANAKKRLTTMEGNLNRARSTLERRPSSSMSSFSARNAEPVSLYAIPPKSRLPGGFSPSKHRQPNLPPLDESKLGHSRVFSETSVPSSLHTTVPNGQPNGEEAQDSDGLGTDSSEAAARDRHSEPSRNWFWNGLTRNTSLNYAGRHNNGLQPLNEDGPAPQFEKSNSQHDDIKEEDFVDLASPTVAAFNAQNPPTTGLTRARSTTQMHELREQMQGLKGKISTLKQRAREDSMKRRSLQSLRTPSPFTAAEQWYMGAASAEDKQAASGSGLAETTQAQITSEEQVSESEESKKDVPQDSGHGSPVFEQNANTSNGSTGHALTSPQEPELKEESPEQSTQIQVNTANRHPSKERLVLIDEASSMATDFNAQSQVPVDEPTPIKGIRPEEGENMEDSLYGDEDFHETATSPVVGRHEDRPDAFDFQHFFLHSAMGSYSGVGMRRSSSRRKRAESQSSESSVETTKPRNSIGEKPRDLDHSALNCGHGRQNSVESVSTVNTFATAAEEAPPEEAKEEPPPRQKVEFPKSRADRIRPELRSRSSFRNRKHIASAQKGFIPTGALPKSPPSEKPALPQSPDTLSYLSSLIPREEGTSPKRLSLSDQDKELVEKLVKSLSKLCGHMHTLGPEGSKYEARVFRRKLDSARRILNGEMNGEDF